MTALSWFRSYSTGRIQTVSATVLLLNIHSFYTSERWGSTRFSFGTDTVSLVHQAVIDNHCVLHDGFAEDRQLQESGQMSDLQQIIAATPDFILDINSWMTQTNCNLMKKRQRFCHPFLPKSKAIRHQQTPSASVLPTFLFHLHSRGVTRPHIRFQTAHFRYLQNSLSLSQ